MPTGPDLGVGLTDALSSILSGLTDRLEAVTNAFRNITGPAEKFVQALSPGTMQVFQGAVRDLNATIGVGLLPVIRVFTDTLHRAAGILLPTMNKIQPVVEKISQTLSGLLLNSVQLLSDSMEEMLPTLDALTGVFDALAEGVKVFQVVIKSMIETISSAIAALFGVGDKDKDKNKGVNTFADVLNKLKTAVFSVIRALVQAAAVLLNTFGGQGALKNLIENFQKAANRKEGLPAGAGGALANVGLKGLEDFQKELAVAATQAVAGGGAKADKEDITLFKEMAASLQEIQKNNVTLQTWVNDNLLPRLHGIAQGAAQTILVSLRDKVVLPIARAIRDWHPL